MIQAPSPVRGSRGGLAVVVAIAILAVGVPAVAVIERPAAGPPVASTPAIGATANASSAANTSPAADGLSSSPDTASRLRGPTRATRVHIPLSPGAMAVAVGAGRVWVASSGDESLHAIEPDGTVAAPAVGLASASARRPTASAATADTVRAPVIGLAAGLVWVAGIPGAHDLVAVDPTRNAVVRRLRLPSPAIGLIGGFGAAWIATNDSRVLRVAADGTVHEVLGPSPSPVSLALGRRDVWASRDGRTIALRPDGRRGTTLEVGGGAVGVDGDTVWVLGQSGPNRDVSAIDERSLTVSYRSDVGTSGFSGIAWALPSITPTQYGDSDSLVAPRSGDSALVGDVAWIGRPVEGELWRIGTDPQG